MFGLADFPEVFQYGSIQALVPALTVSEIELFTKVFSAQNALLFQGNGIILFINITIVI